MGGCFDKHTKAPDYNENDKDDDFVVPCGLLPKNFGLTPRFLRFVFKHFLESPFSIYLETDLECKVTAAVKKLRYKSIIA